VSGELREARAERAEVVSKLGHGERVAPTKATLAEFAETWLRTDRASASNASGLRD
jgi:hypothetical protein